MLKRDAWQIFCQTFLWIPVYILVSMGVFAIKGQAVWQGVILGALAYLCAMVLTLVLSELVFRLFEKIKPTPTEWEGYHSKFDDE